MKILLFLLLTISTFGQQLKLDKKLQKKIEADTVDFQGQVGVYVLNLKHNTFAAINADSIFPTASMIKIPIMLGIFSEIVTGKSNYTDIWEFNDSLKYDDGITGSLRAGTKIPLTELIYLMTSVSDNTASLWIQGKAGGKRINAIMDSLGLFNIKVNSRTEGREDFRKIYGWGQTSPKEMARLIKMLRERKVFTEAASNRMYRTLGNQFWDGEGLSQIPESIKTACKTGAVDRSKSEVTLVHAPHGEYVYCIITKNQKDIRWVVENEGSELIRKLAATFWQHYESKFEPVKGSKNWNN